MSQKHYKFSLNPCYCGTYLLRNLHANTAMWRRWSLNPCCFGSYILRLNMNNAGRLMMVVLILVVLELSFWVSINITNYTNDIYVLILVVLELTFWAGIGRWKHDWERGLNPCCFGTYILRENYENGCLWIECFNPCCCGTYILRFHIYGFNPCNISLNPCCCGSYLLRKKKKMQKLNEITGLNPCCFGTYLLSVYTITK